MTRAAIITEVVACTGVAFFAETFASEALPLSRPIAKSKREAPTMQAIPQPKALKEAPRVIKVPIQEPM